MRTGILKYALISLVCAVCLCGCINKVDGDYHPQINMTIDGKEYLLNTKDGLGDIFYLRKESFSLYINKSYTIAPDAFTFKFMISAEGEPEVGRKYTFPTVETEKAWESFVVLSRWGNTVQGGTSKDYTWHVKDGWLKFTFFKVMEAEEKCLVDGDFGFTLYNIEDPEKTLEITSGRFRDFYIDYWNVRDLM